MRNIRQAQECYLTSLTPVMALAQRFMKKINSSILLNSSIALKYKKKIRVSDTNDSEQDKIYNRMRELKEKVDDKSKAELDNVIKWIAKMAEEKYQKVMEELKNMKPSEGKINVQKTQLPSCSHVGC